MTFVVTENCIKCKYMDCVEVCPVECFHEGPNFLVIDPEECIDCTLCEPECPVEAIFSEEELPAGQEQFKQLNAELAKGWPVITEMKAAQADAKEWEGKPDKLRLLERYPLSAHPPPAARPQATSTSGAAGRSGAARVHQAAGSRQTSHRSQARCREFPAG